MPAADSQKEETLADSSRDVGDKEKERDRHGKPKGSASKTKDLSHVPCKFFKVGSCTAGSSCPFSHTILEPGQQKEVCAWFVKGNCKFGHKCALAHILPGQSMAMDRKNKKAAQAATSAVTPSSGKEGRAGRSQRSTTQGQHGSAVSSRNSLLSGSTAPTRSHSTSRPPIPMPLKATLSPSAPAPPVHATEFASYGLPDESNKLPSAPAQRKTSNVVRSADEDSIAMSLDPAKTDSAETLPSNSPLPASNPSSARRLGASQGKGSDAVDFGPIGSPPRPSPAARSVPLNDLSPGGSPHITMLSTSPFSAPGTQSNFILPEQRAPADLRARSGLSASLGTMMSWASDIRREKNIEPLNRMQDETVVEDGDLEEFIPGSLSDLLTPEEKSRRFSRTNTSRPMQPIEHDGLTSSATGEASHHRHSRSVPAPSLLQDIRSIWTEKNSSAALDAGMTGVSVTGGGLGNGTPSSFQSTSGYGGRPEDILHPSNASAAFLPGLHHFINAKSTQQSNLSSNLSALYTQPSNMSSSHHPSIINGLAHSPSRQGAFAAGAAHDTNASDMYLTQSQYVSARRILGNGDGDETRNAFSPSTRALQAHAPGQSLPQGLAAGYSRIHALPPPPSIPSPSTSAAFSPGRSVGLSTALKGSSHASSAPMDWSGSSPPGMDLTQGTHAASTTNGSLNTLDTMFSRLSYSAAAPRPANTTAGSNSRNTNGRTWHNAQGPLSPLSGPVLTGDDDDLFSFDG